jgi:hypothetical protein
MSESNANYKVSIVMMNQTVISVADHFLGSLAVMSITPMGHHQYTEFLELR